ncbi:peptidase family C50-domain-containing protein [Sporodiniella umbellata]|nr:peptidase family C50-domain-containing protein [Sporodiniella umbellata]
MAKGIHARRLTQTCLSEKLRKLNGCLPLSQNSWPTEKTGKSQSKTVYVSDWLKSYTVTLSEYYSKDHLLNESQFQQEYVDTIPSNWTVCSLTMDVDHNNMYAVQLRSGESPFVIKLSLDRHLKKSDTPYGFKEIDLELKQIIEESDDTIQYSAQCKSPEEVKQWWVKRASLDSRLGKLLSNVEGWFGGFKGILSGRCNESLEDMKNFRDQLNEMVHKIVIKASSKKAKVEFSFHFCSIILQLGELPTYIELEDVAQFILSSYEEHSIHVGFAQVGDEITKLLSNLMSSYHKSSASKGIDTKAIRNNDHVILILDKHMQTLPMENVPILRKQAVSRLPCLSFLRDRIFYAKSKKASEEGNTNYSKVSGNSLRISKENAYYVLNPSGDLVHTQKEFEKLFQSYQDWNGISGTAPMELQLKDALQSRDLYM